MTVDAFFAAPKIITIEGRDAEWFTPTHHARGPWDPDACHAGPPTGLLVRAMERALPEFRLSRIAVDLAKPIPMAGFRIDVDVTRAGRTVAATRATIVDAGDVVRVAAIGLHIKPGTVPLFPETLDNSGFTTPKLGDAAPGRFPVDVDPLPGGATGFSGSAVRVRYPPGEDRGPGATTVWMNTDPLLPDETPSPFQRICPLADCGNAFGRHADPGELNFVNADLTIVLHRQPVGEWLGSAAVGHWQPDGIGMADAVLFDELGPVGRAIQTLVLRAVT